MKKLKWTLALSLIAILAVIVFVKPIRVLYPQILGLKCPEPNICLDDSKQLARAKRLYVTALLDLESRLGPFPGLPKAIFCSSAKCYARFTGSKAKAITIGNLAIVIGPRAWKGWYVRHEFIHHWQYASLGIYSAWRLPDWLKEGMAYGLSRDPRKKLHAPFQSQRSKFLRWYRKIERSAILAAIKKEL